MFYLISQVKKTNNKIVEADGLSWISRVKLKLIIAPWPVQGKRPVHNTDVITHTCVFATM